MKSAIYTFSLILGLPAFLQAAEIRNGYLYAEGLRTPVAIASIDKVEFFFDRIDESLAANDEDLEYIRLRNDEDLWINSKRYAIINQQRIAITLNQEFEIMTAINRSGAETAAPRTEDAQELLNATNSLQLESLETANAEVIRKIRDRLAAFEQKNHPASRTITTIKRSDIPKSLSPWRAVVDNQNVYLEASAAGNVVQISQKTVTVASKDSQICNLSTTKPDNHPLYLYFELRSGSTTYWAHTRSVSIDPTRKFLLTATPGGQTVCYSDAIMKDGFEGL